MTHNPTRINHRWQCPECDNAVMLHVRVHYPPICNNKSVHSRKRVEMKHDKRGRDRGGRARQ